MRVVVPQHLSMATCPPALRIIAFTGDLHLGEVVVETSAVRRSGGRPPDREVRLPQASVQHRSRAR